MTKEMILETGEIVLLDDWIYSEAMKHRWYVTHDGYVRKVKSFVMLQRFVTQATKGMQVRFRNSDRLDVRLVNLEVTLTPAKLRELETWRLREKPGTG